MLDRIQVLLCESVLSLLQSLKRNSRYLRQPDVHVIRKGVLK